ncbi:NACHT domain-containing protein [Nostoc flagelliforme FACHB-838]|uniref:NACHT domain-containing protein n=1 Tax=Nostoc flagelliforme FACHB-838 TaxID=2692904 RepID=A0ABR8DYX8_9NOSO|nr:NB-ARC domain-containing protein [Nostoc flagelliforme]MBD2533594.1 NACHT domain-containing protein [Nostoc flagelliforme FACHB-838]
MEFEEVLKLVDISVVAKTERHLKDIEVAILRGSWQGWKYHEIAEAYGYTSDYLQQDVGPKLWKLLSEALGEKVSKTNFQTALERQWRFSSNTSRSHLGTVAQFQAPIPLDSGLEVEEVSSKALNFVGHKEVIANRRQDWGEAVGVSVFSGRKQELVTLEQWTVKERCRLVALLGMGGIGKTSLAFKLAQQIQDQFEYIIWRSLRNQPLIEDVLSELIQFLNDEDKTDLPKSVDSKISKLIDCLHKRRCLIVLDNFETVLPSGNSTECYPEGVGAYAELLKRVGETHHQSCVILTSREKPKEILLLEGEKIPIHSLKLNGLKKAEVQEIFQVKGSFLADESEWQILRDHYGGNPLALKIAAVAIQDLLNSDISEFIFLLKQEKLGFDDIDDLLKRQFNRLSDVEQEIMYWLAINREPVTFQELREDILSIKSKQRLFSSLGALERSSLLEKNQKGFTQQPVVMEYITKQLIEQIWQEVANEKTDFLVRYALVKAQTKDYVRKIQERVILEPIAKELTATFSSKKIVEYKLNKILSKLKEDISCGYGGGNIINLFRQLNIDLTGYDFSHLTIWQAYLQNVNLHHVNFAYSDLAKSTFTETLGSIFSVAFSANGEFLATSDSDSNIRLWQVTTGRQLFVCKGHTSWAWSITFSPDSSILASCSIDQTTRLWNTSTGECLKILQEPDQVEAITFSPNGSIFASGSVDKTIRLWDVSTGQCLKTLQGHTDSVWSVAFSPNGQLLASGSYDQTVRLWDVHTGECSKILRGHTAWIRAALAFSPNGDIIASGSFDRTVRLWDTSTGQCLETLQGHTNSIVSATFSPDGQTLASCSYDQTVKLWDIHTGQCLRTLQGHTGLIWSVAYSPDGQTLASGSDDQTVKLWNANTGQCLKTLKGYKNSVFSVALCSNGYTLASGNGDQTVMLWNTSTGQCLKTLPGHTSRLLSVAFSPDSQMLASSGCDRTVILWNANTGQCLKTLLGHGSWVWSVAFSPDSQILASSSEDQTVRLWNVSTGQLLKSLQGHDGGVRAIAFNPSNGILISGSYDRTVRLWDVSTGECLKTLHAHENSVWSVAFSQDGQTFASSSDHTIKLWDFGTNKCLKTLQDHVSSVVSVTFSPNGQMLASASEDKTVKLWNVSTGECLKTLQGHTNLVSSVVFSPDSKTLVSSSFDETIKFWDITTGNCRRTLRAVRPYEQMNVTGVVGLTEATIATLKALGAVEDETN